MRYSVKYKKAAEKKLDKLDPFVRDRIKAWIDKNLEDCENPRIKGRTLESYWRYRVGNYRLVADIQDEKIIILIVNADKRNDIYR